MQFFISRFLLGGAPHKVPNGAAGSARSAVNWVTEKGSGKQYAELAKLADDYDDAEMRCAAIGGMLPEPRTREETDFLDNMGETMVMFFLGMTDLADEGEWVWTSDGSPVTWIVSVEGEPDGGTDENCGVMARKYLVGNTTAPIWGSGECGNPYNLPVTVVCEKTRK